MRRKLSLIMTLAAWLFATGSHWDLVQTFAWGHMLAVNSTELPFLAAVKKTFSVEGRCQLCKTIGQARQQHEAANSTAPGEKMPGEISLATVPESQSLFSPVWTCEGLVGSAALPASRTRATPLLPPPRALS